MQVGLLGANGGVGFVDAVVDGEDGVATEADIGVALVMFGKPELAGLGVDVVDFGAANPEGGIASGLGFDFGNGEVVGIDPDGAAIEEAGVGSGLDAEHVAGAAVEELLADEGEFVVGGSGSGLARIRG